MTADDAGAPPALTPAERLALALGTAEPDDGDVPAPTTAPEEQATT